MSGLYKCRHRGVYTSSPDCHSALYFFINVCVCVLAGPGWVASFEDDFNFKADFAGVAIDSGSGVWGGTTVPLNDSEDKGWATFTDFQPFCW